MMGPMPFVFRPMLATPADALPAAGEWAAEIKWDGVRCAAVLEAGRCTLWSRNGNDITDGYPELAELAAAVDRPLVLDGEIVATDDTGRPSFERLQQRMHVRAPDAVARLRSDIPVAFLAFDLLAVDGQERYDRAWHERRAELESLAISGAHWSTPPAAVGDGVAALVALTHDHALEGFVAKRVDARYEPGRRSPAWCKVKHFRSQEFVVGGWEPGTGGRAGTIGSLLLGVHTDAGLRFVGGVGTGFTNEMLAALLDALERIERPTSPFTAGVVPRGARFVEPIVVVDVRFVQWTTTGAIRAPSFRGVRPDIDPTTVVRLD
jgi:bifunctional non-homologous end joining protein LigD